MGFETLSNSEEIEHDPDYDKILNGVRVEELGDTFMFATLAFQKYYAEKIMLRDSSNEMMPLEQSRHDGIKKDFSLEELVAENSIAIRTWLNSLQGKLAVYTYAKGKTMEEIKQMHNMEELEQAYISSLH